MRRLLFVLLFAVTAWGQEPTVTLNGSSYTLQPHPRVFLNSSINSRVAYSGGLAPKATSSNPAWSALQTKAASAYKSYGSPSSTHNFDSSYLDGSVAALYAQVWYSDNSQTTYLTAALYLLNNMQQYVPLVCNEGVKDCINGGNGYWVGSYGPAYYMPNWIYAYELVRSQMTTTQQQTFADKWLNDLSTWGGVDGSPSTSCTNPTVIGSTSVSVSSSGAITASAPYFGAGNPVQVGDWLAESGNDITGVVASVTDSQHATIESDEASSWSGYSGSVFSRRSAWQAGDCGWLWLMKHDWYSPASFIGSAKYASGGSGSGGVNGTGSFNLTLSQTYGPMAALFSLADDDVNFSARTNVELTALYDSWYKTTWQGLNEYNYTGFTPTGSVYGIWRAYTFYPLTSYLIENSTVSGPSLTSGIWAKNMAHHFYMSTFPSCPAMEQEFGQSFSPASSYNNFIGWVPGLPALVSMFSNTNEGQYLNYWMQNLWSSCAGYTGNTPGSNLMWNASALSASSNVQSWFYLYSDPAYSTNSSLPTGSVDNCSDAGCSGQVPTSTALPMAGMISRTGYSSITDTLVNFYALATPEEDHTIPEDGQWNPADYRIFKGNFLLGDDWSTYNNGGPASMAMEIGGDTNITGTGSLPFIVLMPAGSNDASNRYTYALVDSTKSYGSGAQASAVERYLVHFKKPGTQDFVVVYDYVATAAGEQKQTYLHYAQKSSTSLSGNTITSSFAGTGHSDSTQLLSQVLAPQGASSVYTYTNNSNGTYSGGNGDTYRVSLCASSNGTSCNTANTVGEFAVVHEPVAGSSNSMPSTEMLSTIDASHRGIEIDGASPKVAVFPIGASEPNFTSATFTTAHPGTAQYLVAGLTPGTYNVSLNGATIVTGAAVSAGNNSLYFESTAGAIVVSQTGAASLTGITVTPATASLSVGSGSQNFTATCTYSNGTSSTCTTTVTWSSSNTATATITSAGLATGVAAGTATITAASGGVSGTSTVTVTSPTLSSIALSPSTASISVGGTQQLTATCYYSNNTNSSCSSTISWSSSTPATATVSGAGVVSGVAAGTTVITATSGGQSATSTVTVSAATLSGIVVTPATATIVAGTGTQQFTATCSYSNSTTSNCTSTVTWSSGNPAAATISSAGLATGVAAGTSTITATSGSTQGSGALTVTGATVTGITVSPATASIAAGTGTQQYSATCTYSDSTTSNCSSSVTWSSSNTATATIASNGLATGVASGTATIKATSGSASGTAALTVTSPTLSSIALSPSTASIAAGTGTQQFTATCYYANSTNSNCSSTVTWSSSSTATATVSNTGLATGVAAGTSTITATSGTMSATSVLTVTSATLTGITVSPATATLNAGSGTQQYTATCNYSNNTSANCTSTVTWSSSSTATATITSAGIATGVAAGTSTITATSGSLSATSALTVTSNALSAIAISPTTASIVVGTGTQQYSATCTYAGGSTAACPTSMTWTSSSPAIATVSSTGLATGVAVGSTTITAASGTVKATSALTVTSVPLNSITVTPATATVVAGLTMSQYSATCNFANSTSSDCTSTVTWSSTNTSTAKITSPGVVLGVTTGTAKINATSGSTTGSSTLTVLSPALTGISIGAATPSIVAGTGTEQYTATCSYSNNTSSQCTSTVAWSTSNAAVATINSTGLATGVAAGTATITATSGSTTTTSVLTVTNPALTGIAVMPGSASIVSGTGTEQFTATCSYANNTSAACTTTVTWTSSNKSVATISTGGLATGIASGTATITAASGGVTGTSTITVSSPALTGIAVTPGTATVQAGTGTQQFTATCTYANSSTTNCTTDVTWSSSSATTIVITGNGVATGVAPGSAVLTATLGGISGSASVTVSSPSLAGITITPGTASIDAVIGTQQFSASCSYADNTSSVCTSTVTWSSSNNGFATISSGGLATGVAAGSVTITATSGSTSGSSTLTVEPYSPPTGIHRGKWSWMDGSSVTGGSMKAIPSVLSQLDTPSATNTPGGRDGFATWTDSSGNLWLFGGGGFDANGNSGYLNDLWEFTPATMEWTWVGGSSTVPAANQGRSGVYATVGTPSGEAIPGGRQATASWTDASGNLWLFGGEGFDSNGLNGDLNDLWKFTPSSQEWTWVDGSSTVPAAGKGQTGVYGTLGASATGNIPGGRWGANSWTDQNGNLWLFGGVGFDSTGASGSLNDLWEFNASTSQWTWIAGSSTVGAKGGQYGVFGTEGTPASGNVPSSRNQAVTWTDQSGNLWLFGGYGYDSTGTWGYLNDLWQFNLSSRQWAWIGGSSTVGCAGCGQAGVYGTVGTRDSSSQPGGRNQAVGWTDSTGNLWMFGGVGFDSKGVNGDLNDLWEYVLSSNQWAWVGGSNTVPASGKGQSGDYGSRGVPDSNDAPGGRWSSGGWTDPKGDLWLFGGAGYDANGNYDNLNDLWVYQPDPGTLAAATPTLSIGSGTYTGAQSVTIADQIPGATIYYTTNGSAPSTSSTVYSGPITVGSAETIQAIAVATGYGPSGLASANYTIVAPFSLGLGTGANSITVYPGGKANYNLILTPVGSSTFPTGITFTATGLPSGATATFSPSTVNAGAGLTGVTFAVQTQSESPATAMLHQPGKTGNLTGGSLGGALLCLLFLPLAAVARWRKTARYLARHASLMVWLLILAGITAAVTGCGGGASINSNAVAAPAASYTITITATSGTLQKSTTVTLSVR